MPFCFNSDGGNSERCSNILQLEPHCDFDQRERGVQRHDLPQGSVQELVLHDGLQAPKQSDTLQTPAEILQYHEHRNG